MMVTKDQRTECQVNAVNYALSMDLHHLELAPPSDDGLSVACAVSDIDSDDDSEGGVPLF
jgi:hypothetical protein